MRHAAPAVCWLSTVASFRQPSILRNLICPLATRMKSRTSAASSLGSEPCVFTRRRNSSWNRSIVFVVRLAHRRALRAQRCQPQGAAALRDQWHPAGARMNASRYRTAMRSPREVLPQRVRRDRDERGAQRSKLRPYRLQSFQLYHAVGSPVPTEERNQQCAVGQQVGGPHELSILVVELERRRQITDVEPGLRRRLPCTGSVEGSCHRTRRLLRAPPGASSRSS